MVKFGLDKWELYILNLQYHIMESWNVSRVRIRLSYIY